MKTLMKLLLAVSLMLGLGLRSADAEPATVRVLADQAVLVHRVTKSVCMVLIGAETPVHVQDISHSTEQLVRLSHDLDTRADVSKALLADVDTLTKSARQIAAGDLHTVPLTLILRINPDLADAFDQMKVDAPSTISAKNRGSFMLVQDLRVVSQAFQRDLCLALTGLAPDGANEVLARKIAFFAVSMDRLVTGRAKDGLVAAPNIHIKITLGKVAGKWKTLEPILSAAAAGQPIDPRDAQLASVLGDAILKNLDDITDRFLAL